MITRTYAGRYYLISGLFSATRMTIGATSAIFMLHKGFTLSDLATVKIIQGFVIFFTDIPTGLFADTFGRKASIMAAVGCAVLNFFFYLHGSTLLHMSLAETFNALAISFWSGAFEAILIEHLRSRPEMKANLLEVVFSRSNTVNSISTMAGGLAGGWLGSLDERAPFWLGIIFGLSTMLFIQFMIKDETPKVLPSARSSLPQRSRQLAEKIKSNLVVSFEKGLLNPKLRTFFWLQVIIQFLYQPIFHYWQPYFQKLFPLIGEREFGFIFCGYMTSQFLVSMGVSYLMTHKIFSAHKIILIELVILSLGLSLMSLFISPIGALAGFLAVQGMGASARSLLNANFNRFIPSEQRATILSSVSFVSRGGMLVCLFLLQYLMKHIPIEAAFFLSLGAALILMPVYLSWSKNLEREVSTLCAVPA